MLQEEEDVAAFIENDLSDDNAPKKGSKRPKQGTRQINLSDSDED